ncbi:MAG: MscL family protein [Bradymonadales bacterium]|nr:MscL family protein [Bradymonadales bacterium]
MDFGNLFIALDGKHYETLEAATTAGAAVIKYGSFVSALINFIIMALVVFMIVKAVNKMRDIGKKPEPEAAPTTKECPFCKSDIAIAATRCPHCTSIIEEK